MFGWMLAAVVCFSANSVCTRFFQVKLQSERHSISAYQALFCTVAAVLFFLSGEKEIPTADTVCSGILFGVFFFCAVMFSTAGFEKGSMALTSVIVNMSLILPVLYSTLILGEKMGVGHVVGIVLFLVTFVLSSDSVKKERIGRGWLIVVLVAFLCNGMSAVVQKRYILHSEEAQTGLLMAIAYLTAALLFAGRFLLSPEGMRKEERPTVRYSLSLCVVAMISGAGSFGGNLLLCNLSDKINGSVLYPCVNGGLCLLLTGVSCLIFREKLNVRKTIALLCGGIAIVILNLGG